VGPEGASWLGAVPPNLPAAPSTQLTANPQPVTPPTSAEPSPTTTDPKTIIDYLASDDLEGRGIGMPGLDLAAKFISDEFTADGLRPLPGQKDFFQPFTYTAGFSVKPDTMLTIGDHPYSLSQDFTPISLSLESKFSGPVAFVGYGVSDPDDKYDDYAGIDVKGKVVLAMRYEPADKDGKSRLAKPADEAPWSQHAWFSEKARVAADHGAVALLVVTPVSAGMDVLPPLGAIPNEGGPIPVIQIRRNVADAILKQAGAGDLQSQQSAIDLNFRAQSIELKDITAAGNVEFDRDTVSVKNVIGYLPGQGPHADEFVVIGAHYDHLGKGQHGHQFGPVGSIYHGADDNASGTATVLELASRFANGPAPDRSIVFMSFTAEEEGLIGSKQFVNHPLIPLDKIVAMVNLDMVGRVKDQTLFMGGQGTAKDLDAIVQTAGQHSKLALKSIGSGGLGPSDHMSFALKRIPVLFFFSGLHADYHRPTDTADKVNYTGIQEVADLTFDVVQSLTKMPKEDYIVEADKDSMTIFGASAASTQPVRKVLLGVIPDYNSEDSHVGVLIAGTTPGSPAEAAGLQAGDLIVQFGDTKLQNLTDLSVVLGHAEPGQKIAIQVLRGKAKMNLEVTLAERKD
jgi:hypothetical protein